MKLIFRNNGRENVHKGGKGLGSNTPNQFDPGPFDPPKTKCLNLHAYLLFALVVKKGLPFDFTRSRKRANHAVASRVQRRVSRLTE